MAQLRQGGKLVVHRQMVVSKQQQGIKQFVYSEQSLLVPIGNLTYAHVLSCAVSGTVPVLGEYSAL